MNPIVIFYALIFALIFALILYIIFYKCMREDFVNGADSKLSLCIGQCEDQLTSGIGASFPYLERGLISNDICKKYCEENKIMY